MDGDGQSVECGRIGELPLGGVAGYHPDRSFETIACSSDDPLSVLAALEKGSRAALVSPSLGEKLMGLGRGSGALEGVAVCRVLGFDDGGRLAVPRLRSWVGEQVQGMLRVAVNSPVGPYLCRPLQMGADVVIEDLGSLMDPALLPEGLGGPRVVVVARTDWVWESFWDLVGQKDAAQDVSPADCARLGAGLRCLSGTSQRRSDTASAVAHYLDAHPRIPWVSYPGLAGDGANENARATFEHGFGPLVAFGLPQDGVSDAARPDLALNTAGRSGLYRGVRPGTWVFSAGLESALDVVASLDRIIAEGLALGSNGR